MGALAAGPQVTSSDNSRDVIAPAVTSFSFFLHNGRVMARLPVTLCLGLAALVTAGQAFAQTVPPPVPVPVPPVAQTPAKPISPTGPPVTYEFPSGAGLLIFHVAPAKAADFDAVLVRLKAALSTVEGSTRKLQTANWLIYKSAETPGDSVVYLFLFDPAVPKASYDPLLVLAEALPAEAQPLYERMKAAVVRIERMGLTRVR